MKLKPFFRRIHLWLSVPFGLVITLICFSGAMLVFEDEISHALNRDRYYVDRVGQRPLPLDSLARRVRAALPDSVGVSGVTVYADKERTYKFSLTRPRRAAMYVDQYTGEVKGRESRLPFFSFMFRLHRWLLDTNPGSGNVFWGKMVVGVSVLVLVVIMLTGMVIWWPRRVRALNTALKVKCSHGFRQLAHSLHSAGGVYVLVPLLIMALTGLTWSFSWYRNAVYGVFGAQPPAAHGAGAGQSGGAAVKGGGAGGAVRTHGRGHGNDMFTHWQSVYDRLHRIAPSAPYITVSKGKATVACSGLGNSRAADSYEFDSVTGRITSARIYADGSVQGKLRGWIYSLHVGQWGGWVTKVLWFVGALLGAILPLTGYYMWIRRLCRGSR